MWMRRFPAQIIIPSDELMAGFLKTSAHRQVSHMLHTALMRELK